MVDRTGTVTIMDHPAPSLDRLAFSATIHCLTGCGIGEVLGLVISTLLGWHDVASIALAIVLAFAADALSITVMEIVDNTIVVLIPGAMSAGITTPLFWGSLALSLAVAGVAAYPVNRWLIKRGRGHAVIHGHH